MSFSGDVRSIQPDAQASIVAAEVKENILPSIGSKDGEISDGEDATPFRIRVHADLSDDDDDSDNGDKHGMDGDLDHHTSWTFETRTGRQVPPISLRNDVPTVPKQDVDGDASVSTSSSINLKSTSLPHAPLDHSEEEHQRLEGELAAAQSQINEMKLQLDKSRLLEQTIRNLEAEISTLKTRPLDNSGEATPGLSPAHQPSSEVSSLERELAEERAQHEESKKLVMRLTDKYYKYKQLRSVMEQALAKRDTMIKSEREHSKYLAEEVSRLDLALRTLEENRLNQQAAMRAEQRLVASSFYELGVECQSLLASRSASMAIPLAHPQTTHLESPSGPRYHQATSGSWLNKHRARLGLGPSHSGIFP